MAQKRMFSKTITNSSKFLMMPLSSQALYLHLGMNADDDGYCEYFGIMRMTGANADDLKVLAAKGFVQVFDELVLVVMDWKTNNTLRRDTYVPSKYLGVYETTPVLLDNNAAATERQRDVNGALPKISKGKVSKDKIENSLSYLESIPEDDVTEFTNTYDLTEKQLKDKAECLADYCRSHGKKYRNYKAFLRNAIRKDFRKRVVSPAFHYEEVPQEVKERNLARIAEMREKVHAK